MEIGKDAIEEAVADLRRRVQNNCHCLMGIKEDHPEWIPVIARLLTEHAQVLDDTFGVAVDKNTFGHRWHCNFAGDLEFICNFISQALDDGSPGVGYAIWDDNTFNFCTVDTKIETRVSKFVREHGGGEPRYRAAEPFICRTTDYADWIEYATIARILEVMDYHRKENMEKWASYRASGLDYHGPGLSQQNRIQLAKDMGLVPSDFVYVMVDPELDKKAVSEGQKWDAWRRLLRDGKGVGDGSEKCNSGQPEPT
jgi:hypothetical protein